MSEKASMQGATHFKSELENAKLELEAARRNGNLETMAEIQYSIIPKLEKNITESMMDSEVERELVRNKVTEDEIAEVVAKWTGIPVAKLSLIHI